MLFILCCAHFTWTCSAQSIQNLVTSCNEHMKHEKSYMRKLKLVKVYLLLAEANSTQILYAALSILLAESKEVLLFL